MNAHPHGEKLSAYLDGMLDVAQMRDVAGHLNACPPCHAVYDGLRQTKSLLSEMDVPTQPAPEFWANAYRRMRVEDAGKLPVLPRLSWEGLRDVLGEPQRRWSAGLAAVALVAAAIAGPLVNNQNKLLTNLPPATVFAAPSPDAVDVSSLVQAHAESAARQPLADADRQDMIAMDDSAIGDDVSSDVASTTLDAVGDVSQ